MEASNEKLSIVNSSGERLVGILQDTGSKELVILCHGLNSSKDVGLLVSLAKALSQAGLSVFRFDFSGNGESEGEFQFGSYSKETIDLHDVVLHWIEEGRVVKAILGHSKGGSSVLLYASKFKEVSTIVNASGRLDLKAGLDKLLSSDYLERLEAGPITVKNPSGNTMFGVTKESLMERLSTDLVAAIQTIPKDIRVMSVHGSEDELVPVENAHMCDKLIANHTLEIIEGADHMYSQHEKELGETVKKFILEE
ncbi:hypothetical protein GOP47_0028528 [Adiantum capillus-veneris]|nr:hypothetical protein GOP47_0028528 [Adiantum capillus-veneris]